MQIHKGGTRPFMHITKQKNYGWKVDCCPLSPAEAESALFMEKMRVEYDAEQEIKKLLDDKEVSMEIKRIFKLKVRSEV